MKYSNTEVIINCIHILPLNKCTNQNIVGRSSVEHKHELLLNFTEYHQKDQKNMQVLVKAFLFMGEHIYKHQTCVNDVNIGRGSTRKHFFLWVTIPFTVRSCNGNRQRSHCWILLSCLHNSVLLVCCRPQYKLWVTLTTIKSILFMKSIEVNVKLYFVPIKSLFLFSVIYSTRFPETPTHPSWENVPGVPPDDGPALLL